MRITELRNALLETKNEQDTEKIITAAYLPAVDRARDFNDWSNTFEGAFLMRHPKGGFLLRDIRAAIGSEYIRWEDLTRPNLKRVVDCLSERLASNSVVLYAAWLKALMNEYADTGVLPTTAFAKSLTTKRAPSQNIALTEDEMRRIEAYVPRTETEYDVKAMMMLEMWTGARGSDTAKFTEKNIRDGRLTYVSQKTQIEASVPVHDGLKQYVNHKPSARHAPKVVNETLRRICKRCGITQEVQLFYRGKMRKGPKYEFLSLHSCRRSFCTALAMRGVPTTIIQQFAGHTTQQMTERYIVADTTKLDDNTMAFFKSVV